MKYKDFDAFWAEQKREPIRFRLYGHDEELPASLPALVVLKFVRVQREHPQGDVPAEVMADLAFAIFGEERVEAWSCKGLTTDQLGDLLSWAMEQYTQGNPVAPATG